MDLIKKGIIPQPFSARMSIATWICSQISTGIVPRFFFQRFRSLIVNMPGILSSQEVKVAVDAISPMYSTEAAVVGHEGSGYIGAAPLLVPVLKMMLAECTTIPDFSGY